jgi:Type VI secretion system, TssO
MQPINKSERRKALLNFMLLFLVCSGIIITTVFFSTRIPLKQNNQLLEFKNTTVKNAELKSDFTDKFITISKMVDDLGNKTPAEIKIADIEINNQLAELGKLITESDGRDKELYEHILKNLSNYHEEKIKVKEGIETGAADKKLEDKVAELRRDNEQLYKSLDDCRKSRAAN